MIDTVDMSDMDFVALIRVAEQDLGIGTLADALRVSVPTVGRWAVGKNLPHAGMRPAIAEYIGSAAAQKRAEASK